MNAKRPRVTLALMKTDMSFKAVRGVITSFVCFLMPGLAGATYISDFETLSASNGGTVLTGQDSFYLPTVSTDFYAYTYAGNSLGLPQNPQGGAKFVAGIGPAITGTISGARAQRDTALGSGTWTFAYDFAASYVGTDPATQFVGSFSTQPSGNSHFVHLMSWVDPTDPTTFNAFYLAFNESGNEFDDPERPGSAWESLLTNNWYRAWTTVDFDTNRIVEVGIQDIQGAGAAVAVNPSDWYLEGGMAGSPDPTAFRFFAGGTSGSTGGNTLAFDNVSIAPGEYAGIPEPATLALVCLGLAGLGYSRRRTH